MSAAFGCHTCGRIDTGPFVWVAKRRSIRHEREAHGFSFYDPDPVRAHIAAAAREEEVRRAVEEINRDREATRRDEDES